MNTCARTRTSTRANGESARPGLVRGGSKTEMREEVCVFVGVIQRKCMPEREREREKRKYVDGLYAQKGWEGFYDQEKNETKRPAVFHPL